jgi:hypothetical protein
MSRFDVLHNGEHGEAVRQLQAATNRRLRARDLDAFAVEENGHLKHATLEAVRKAAWALGAMKATYDGILADAAVPVGIQRMILNPGTRSAEQLQRAEARMSNMRADRKKRAAEAAKARAASSHRDRVVHLALEAAGNYRKNPGAYHYLAGGQNNLIFLEPTPKNFRSDCTQFCAAVYAAAGLPSPATVEHKQANTTTMAAKGRRTDHPRPGDLGMYGSFAAPHHVEMYVGAPGAEFIGHGSPPIDSGTPGRPSYFLTYDFLG